MSEIKGCPWCGTEPKIFGKLVVQCINEFNCPNAYGRPIKLDEWEERPIEDALLEACEIALVALTSGKGERTADHKLRAAIAKARGEG